MPRADLLTPELRHSHAGLLMDRFLRFGKDFEAPADGEKQRLVAVAAGVGVPDGYSLAYELRRRGFEQLRERNEATLAQATVLGRVALGLGARGVLESGLRLEHTWGVPVLPGSALKGVAAAAAH